MRLLLDTHVALWAVSGHPNLSSRSKVAIGKASACWVSAVSLWEIAIKHALGRSVRDPMNVDARRARSDFFNAGFQELACTPDHAVAVGSLPVLHKDPFDRLLVAQAMSEPLILLTQDADLGPYGAMVMVA